MLFQSLDKIKRNAVMTTIVLMFIGNSLMFVPEEIYFTFLNSALGFVLLVVAATGIFHFISSPKALIHFIYLALSMFAFLMGIMFFVMDDLLLRILTWLVGVFPILFGAYGIYHAIAFARRSGRKGWWILIILSAALMSFGGMIFWNPWMDSTRATIQVIGGTMMFSAIVSALRLIWLWPIRTGEN